MHGDVIAVLDKIRSAGMFDTLYWADMPEHCRSPKPDEVRVEMQAFSMNSWDVMTARGELDGNSTFLMEGAGIVREAGQQVEGFSVGDVIYSFNPKGLATTSNIYAQRAIRIPHGMDIRTAVAVPLAYGTALHCLRDIARMQPGESILIHSAAGAVGQAAIALAKYYQAGEIFVTASSPEKKQPVTPKAPPAATKPSAPSPPANAQPAISVTAVPAGTQPLIITPTATLMAAPVLKWVLPPDYPRGSGV